MAQLQKILSFSLLIFFLNLNTGFSQSKNDSLNRYLQSIEKIYGINDRLINGYPYIQPDDRIKGHPFFLNTNWHKGIIYIGDEKFENKPIKYDIVNDELIHKADFGNQRFKLIQINKLLIDSFKIANRFFIKSTHLFNKPGEAYYFERIYESSPIAFVRRLSKNFISVYNTISPHGKFSKLNESKFLITEDNILDVSRKRDYIRFFPKDKRKIIRKYIKKNKIDYSEATEEELKKLSNFSFR